MDLTQIPTLELTWGQLQTCCVAVGSANFVLKNLRESNKSAYMTTFGALVESWGFIRNDLDRYPDLFQPQFKAIDPRLMALDGEADDLNPSEFGRFYGRIYRAVDKGLLSSLSFGDSEMLRGMVARALNDAAKP